MEEDINAVAKEALDTAKAYFGVDDVSVQIIKDKEQVIPETGIGGFTSDSHTIYVYYDSSNKHFKENLEQKIRSTITHEFHHAVRNRTFNWQEDTLLGAMVTEGLADHFDIEVNGGEPKPWSTALAEPEFENIKKIAESEFESREYNHADWFFGSPERSIPRWAGYAVGFKLVGDYLKKTGKKASELAAEPARSFISQEKS